MDTVTKKPCRFINIVIKSKLCPINKGLVLEETKTKPLGFIRMLINKVEIKNDYMEALIETHREYKFGKIRNITM
tara:strand:+ start:324 stop:548 length:225 start_codon:yes stop_codon:yes gene_type:complete